MMFLGRLDGFWCLWGANFCSGFEWYGVLVDAVV